MEYTTVVWQSLASIILVLAAMYLGIRLVMVAARLCLVLLLVGGCVFAVAQIVSNQWGDWPAVISYSALTGFTAALLSIPLLPFTRFWKK